MRLGSSDRHFLFFIVQLNNFQVYTFVGSPSDVVEAALAASRVAYQLIDMARHKGSPPPIYRS